MREELCPADGGTSPRRGSSRTRQPRKAEWGPWEATQGVELSTWKCLDGERLQWWRFFQALPGQGRLLMQRLDSIRVAQNLAACRLHFAHGHVSFSLCKIVSEILGPIFASQVISHKNYLQNKEGLAAERLYLPEARVLADLTGPPWPGLSVPGSHFPSWPPALPTPPAPAHT